MDPRESSECFIEDQAYDRVETRNLPTTEEVTHDSYYFGCNTEKTLPLMDRSQDTRDVSLEAQVFKIQQGGCQIKQVAPGASNRFMPGETTANSPVAKLSGNRNPRDSHFDIVQKLKRERIKVPNCFMQT